MQCTDDRFQVNGSVMENSPAGGSWQLRGPSISKREAAWQFAMTLSSTRGSRYGCRYATISFFFKAK